MNDAPANTELSGLAGAPRDEGWSRKKWLTIVAIIFAAHIAIIFAFGEKNHAVPRAVARVPLLIFAGDSGGSVALDDPTLFALPHVEGFGGSAWVNQHPGPIHRQDWSEQPRWLPMPAENLGATFSGFMQTNVSAGHALDFKPAAKLSAPAPVQTGAPQNSTLQITGDLAHRPLLEKIELPSLPYGDVIAPSIVQVPVNAAGDVVSTVLLETSGYKDADDRALELARAAHFAPAKELTVGQMIFHWRTIPITNEQSR